MGRLGFGRTTLPAGPPRNDRRGCPCLPTCAPASRNDLDSRWPGQAARAAGSPTASLAGFGSLTAPVCSSRPCPVSRVRRCLPPIAQEVLVARALPQNVPAPRLRWTTEQDEWLVLAFDDVSGRTPQRPWQPEELCVVLDMLTPLAAVLTPVPAALPQLDTTADIDRDFSFWRRLAGGEASADPRLVSEQFGQHLGALAALEADWAALAAGETAVQFDMREDNLLLTGDGQALVCDWNWLTIAGPWVDLVGLLISVHGDGLDAEAVLGEHPLSRDAPPRAVDAFLVAMAGYFTEVAARPAFPHSPWMRTHQAWWRDGTLSWLALRLRL
jgi:aminoglycoside phosphotransferase (APT) family kinase protein